MRNALFHNLAQYQARYEQEHKAPKSTTSNAMRNIVLLILMFVLNACGTCKQATQAQIDAEYRAIPRVITLTPVTVEYFDRCQEDQPCWQCETMGNKICGNKGGK